MQSQFAIAFGNINRTARRVLVAVVLCAGLVHAIPVATAQSEFNAVGPAEPVKLPPREKAAVKVTFELLPTRMEFDLPAFPCMVTENNIKYSNFWAETYEPRIGGGSFEPLFDRRNRYARMWIERQSDARIVVRVRGALCNTEEQIAHADIPSGSPYGKGDWVDE